MNIGQKVILLKESAGFKNFQEFGKFADLNGDWILELSKKQEISTIDVTRLQRIASKFNVTIDWLLSDESEEIPTLQFPDDDLTTRLTDIQNQIVADMKFEGTPLTKETVKLAQDGIEVVKKLIRQNL